MTQRTYSVTYPVAGEVTVQVQASSEDEAIELGWDGITEGDLMWNALEHIVEGNVFCSEFTNDIVVELVEGGE